MSSRPSPAPVRALGALGRFLYDFVVGDDWTIPAVAGALLIITYLVAHHGAAGVWWLLPAGVALALAASVWRAARRRP